MVDEVKNFMVQSCPCVVVLYCSCPSVVVLCSDCCVMLYLVLNRLLWQSHFVMEWITVEGASPYKFTQIHIANRTILFLTLELIRAS